MASLTKHHAPLVGREYKLSEAMGWVLRQLGVRGCFGEVGVRGDKMLEGLGGEWWGGGVAAAGAGWKILRRAAVAVVDTPYGWDLSECCGPVVVLEITDGAGGCVEGVFEEFLAGVSEGVPVRVEVPSRLVSAPFTFPSVRVTSPTTNGEVGDVLEEFKTYLTEGSVVLSDVEEVGGVWVAGGKGLAGALRCSAGVEVVAVVSENLLVNYGVEVALAAAENTLITVVCLTKNLPVEFLGFKQLVTHSPLSPRPTPLLDAITSILSKAGAPVFSTPSAASAAASETSPAAVICTATPTPLPAKPIVQIVLTKSPLPPLPSKLILTVTEAGEIPSALQHAVKMSVETPASPVTVSIPSDASPDAPSVCCEWPTPSPPHADELLPADILKTCELHTTRLHIACGPLSSSICGIIASLVEAFDMTVTTSPSSKGVFPETHPNWLWPGPLPPPDLQPALTPCTACISLGTPPTPTPPNSTIIQHPAAFLPLFTSVALPCKPSVARELISKCHASHNARLESDTKSPATPSLRTIFSKLQATLPGNTVYCLDHGLSYVAGVEHLRVLSCDQVVLPLDTSHSGVALPAAVGLCHRVQATSVVVVGDGGFLESYPALVKAVEGKLPLVVVVLRNGEKGLLNAQYVLAGRAAPARNRVPHFNMERAASFCGATMRRADGDSFAAALQWATGLTESGNGPVVLEVTPKSEVPFSVIASLLPRAVEAADVVETAQAAPMSKGSKNVELSKAQRLVRATVEPGDFYAPIVRQHDTSFAVNELSKRTASGEMDIWDILGYAHEKTPTKTAYVEGGVKATYSEMYARICRVAGFLRDTGGMQRGDRVGIITPNIYQCLESHYAIAGGARGVALNLNQRLSAEELAYVLDDAEPVWVVTASRFAPLILDAVKKSKGSVKGLLWVGDIPSAAANSTSVLHYDYEKVANDSSVDVVAFAPQAGTPDDGCEMYYTSGTTGRPKGVILTQRIVVLHALGCMIEHRHHPGDVWGHIAPMFHLVDAYGMFSITWVCGTHAFVPVFSAANALSAIEDYGITVTNMASTMATLLLTHPGVEKRDFRSLEMLSCGGAPLNRETTLRAIAVFGCEIFQSYGMTECCGKISMSLLNNPEVQKLPAHEQLDLVCTSGKPFALPGFEVRVVDNDNNVVAPLSGDVGEVQIRGPTVFKGYHNRPEANAESFDGDWFKTGDLATVGGHGYITVCDRKKDMILTGGENVYSVEVERVLADHGEVKYVGVYAIPNSLLGEVVKAVVELHPNATVTAQKLRRHCERFLADYKVPRELEIVADMPLTGTGKVAKAELKKREAAKREEKAKTRKAQRTEPQAPQASEYLQNDTYHVTWAPEGVGRSGAVTGHWVVLADEGGIGTTLADKLITENTNVVTVGHGTCADPFAADTFKQLIRQDTEGVVFMWGLDHSPVGGEAVTEAVTDQVHSSLRSLLALLQAILSVKATMNIWIVTRGAEVDVPGTPAQCMPVHATQQALWGIARVIPAERTGLRCRVVDLCPGDSDVGANATALRSEITAPDRGSSHYESAWRARRRYVPRLALLQLPSPQRPRLIADATYVITGGLGGLGRNLTRFMVASWGAKHLVLVSRRKPAPEVAKELEALEARYGATIKVESADISKADSTEALLAKVASSMPTIKGIFHLAGVVDDGKIEDQTWDRFSKVLVPKVDGSVNLHVATEKLKLDLDHFVLFSSIYGVLGYRELTHYAAANAFQDGLALARRRMGLPALAVSWGTWADAGMASRFGTGFENFWKGLGMEFVPLEGGMQTLGALCMEAAGPQGKVHHAGVFPADWERYTKQRRQLGAHPLCNNFVTQPAEVPVDTNLPPLLKALLAVPSGQRLQEMEKHIIKMILELKDEDDQEVDPALPVVDIGLTSMHVIDLTVQLGEASGIEDISPTLVYECVTITAVAERLLEGISEQLGKASQQPSQSAVDPNATVLVQKLQGAQPFERTKILCDAVVELTKELLDDDSIEIDVTAPVVELGLTSMHVVDMTQQLVDITGYDDLSPTFVYECVTIEAVVAQLLEELPLASAVPVIVQSAVKAEAVPAAQPMGPFAVVGMGCRLPGDANTPSEFWENLEAERNCVVPTPGGRPSNGKPSGYLSAATIKNFDREAFGISGPEAECMDPQQRLLLQVAKEAFEDAGIKVEELEDRRVGVFVGVSNVEYGALCMREVEKGRMNPLPYCGTSWHLSIAANRISYLLDLTGPSVSMDTACSSSLTAMDFAVKALREGNCSMALVCGANVQLVETWSDCFQVAGMLSPTFACKFGDNSADGYVRGEGVGAVLIKPLEAAVSANDNIYAEVVGTAINQDARSNGLTAPNPAAQEALLKAAYASIDPHDVVYVEAHGTGTHLGDPIELTALGRVLGAPKDVSPRSEPLLLGSVKSCIGHLECAAGIASIIKTCLILRNGKIPPSLHFSTPNSIVRWETLGLEVAGPAKGIRDLPLPPSNRAPIIGVSGFGFGGTNGHCILRQHQQQPIDKTALRHSGRCLIPISTHSEASLEATARRWSDVAKQACESGYPTLADFGRTAALHRYHGNREKPIRATVVAADMSELAARLAALASGTKHPCVPQGRAVTTPKIAFVFTGQGSQTVGMGRGLYETSKTFHSAMEECERILTTKKLLPEGGSLLDTLYGPADVCEAAMSNAGFLQPALLSVEYSLSQLVEEELMVRPAVVMGHSLGEITACVVAGILTLEDALTLAAGRGSAMAAIPAGQSGMAAVRSNRDELDAFLKERAPKVAVAAVNAPGSCVISGPLDDLKAAIACLKENGKKVRQLAVSHGFHSSAIEGALSGLRKVASGITARPVREGLVTISNVTGTVQTQLPDAEYWVRHARGAVLFMSGVNTALDLGTNVFLELGPQPHLTVQMNGIVAGYDKHVAVVGTLKAGEDETELMAISAAALHNAGVALQWDALCSTGTRIQLPPNAFAGAEQWCSSLEPTKRQRQAQLMDQDPRGAIFGTEWCEQPSGAGVDLKGRAVLLVSDNPNHKGLIPELKGLGCQISKVTAAPTELSIQKLTAAIEERPRWHCMVFSCSTPDYMQCTAALLRTVQVAQRSRSVDRLLILTNGVCSDRPSEKGLDVGVACQAALWGFSKSARLELANGPLLQCCDIDPSSADVAKAVVTEISAEHFGHDNVRLAGGGFGRRVERVIEVKQAMKHKYAPPVGPIILTGGTGALGLQLSEWLIKRGAKKIVLLSRSGKIGAANNELWEILKATSERHGAEVKLQRCDVSDAQQADAMVGEYARELATGGIVHCAGVLDDGLLRSQTEERYSKVMTPKVGGLLFIFKSMMARSVRPALFLLFSSVTSLMGNIGQTSYGAANAVLDSVAKQLRAAEFPCTSVQWGPWGGHGMAAFMDAEEGVNTVWRPLTGSIGWGALDVALAPGQDAVLCVSGFKWNNLREHMAGSPWSANYFGGMIELYPEGVESESSVVTESDIEEAASEEYSEADVFDQLKGVLNKYVKAGTSLAPGTEMISLGLDSVDMTATAQDISKKFSIKAGPMVVMEAATLGELRSAVSTELAKGSSTKTRKAVSKPARNPLKPAPVEEGPLSEAEVLEKLKTIFSGFTKGNIAVTMGTELVGLSLDSVDMTAIAQEIGKQFGIKAGPMLVMEAQTVAELVTAIKGAGAAQPKKKVVEKKPKTVKKSRSPRPAVSPEACATQLMEILSQFSKSNTSVTPMTELLSLSLDSVDMTAIAQEVSKKFNVKVSPMFVMECDTVEDLRSGIMAKVPQQSPAASPASRRPAKAAEEPDNLKEEVINLKCENELLQRQANVHVNEAPWVVEVAFKVVPLVFTLLGFFVSVLLSALITRPVGFIMDLAQSECGVGIGHFLTVHVFFELVFKIGGFLVLFLVFCVIYAFLLKWAVIGRFKAHTWHSYSWYSFRRSIVMTYLEQLQSMLVVLEETEVLVWFYRALGADIGKNVHLPWTLQVDFDLVHIGDNCIIGSRTGCQTSYCPDGIMITSRHTWIGNGSMICRSAYVMPGAQLGQAVVVCAKSIAQGSVISGATVYEDKVLLPGEQPPEDTGVCTFLRTKDGTTMPLILMQLLFLFLLLVFMVLCFTFAIVWALWGFTMAPGICKSDTIPSPFITIVGVDLYLTAKSAAVLFCTLWVLGFTCSALAVAVKWLFIGKLRPGTEVVTNLMVMRFWFVGKMCAMSEVLFITNFFRYTPIMWAWYRALGMRVPCSAIMSAFISPQPDLISSDADAYFGFNPQIPCMAVDPVDGIVTFASTHVGSKGFIGPDAMLLPGANIEERGAVSASGLVGAGKTIKTGTTQIGPRVTVAFRPDAKLANNALFQVYLMLFALWRAVWDVLLSLLCIGGSMVVMISLHGHGVGWPCALAVAVAMIVFLLAVVVPIFQAALSILNKWVFLWKVQEGVHHRWRSFYHARWVNCLAVSMKTVENMKVMYRGTVAMRVYHRLRGGKVGAGVKMMCAPRSPEAELVEFKDGAYMSEESGHIYAHNFASGDLHFEKVTIGASVRLPTNTHVVPGSSMNDGVTTGPCTLILPRGMEEKCDVVMGNPGKPCAAAAEGDFFVRAGNGVIALDFTLAKYNEALLRASAHNDIEATGSDMGELQRQRSRHRRRSALQASLLNADPMPNEEEELEVLQLTTADGNEGTYSAAL